MRRTSWRRFLCSARVDPTRIAAVGKDSTSAQFGRYRTTKAARNFRLVASARWSHSATVGQRPCARHRRGIATFDGSICRRACDNSRPEEFVSARTSSAGCLPGELALGERRRSWHRARICGQCGRGAGVRRQSRCERDPQRDSDHPGRHRRRRFRADGLRVAGPLQPGSGAQPGPEHGRCRQQRLQHLRRQVGDDPRTRRVRQRDHGGAARRVVVSGARRGGRGFGARFRILEHLRAGRQRHDQRSGDQRHTERHFQVDRGRGQRIHDHRHGVRAVDDIRGRRDLHQRLPLRPERKRHLDRYDLQLHQQHLRWRPERVGDLCGQRRRLDRTGERPSDLGQRLLEPGRCDGLRRPRSSGLAGLPGGRSDDHGQHLLEHRPSSPRGLG